MQWFNATREIEDDLLFIITFTKEQNYLYQIYNVCNVAVVCEHNSCKRLGVHLHTRASTSETNRSVQIERRLLDIFVVLQRRNRLAKSDSDHNYHEYILRKLDNVQFITE